ncbi:MAG: hypothetical protein WBG08_04760 [Litorimonas sp.]
MRCALLWLPFLLFATANTAHAQLADPALIPDPTLETPLEGEALELLFQDRTHRGYYQYGDWTDLEPAFTERMGADGSAVHDQDGVRSVGTWRVRHNVVCFEYTTLQGGCFNIFRKGTCNFAFSAMSRTLVAVTVLDEETPDCEPSIA